ncbi:MAG TPA: tetratricopeptide repeat protein [Caulobacteraceae bacterium]
MLRRLFALCLAASLGACATERMTVTHAAAAGAAPDAAQPPAPPADTSSYGLFLAGEAARDEGHLGAAAFYLTRAAAVEGGPPYLRADAFNAALQAGDIAGAAALAPDAADSGADASLGRLVRGVEAMAEGRDRDAYVLLASAGPGGPPATAAQLLAPFAAAGAGDAAHALARPVIDADLISQFIADLDRAELQERLGKRDAAEASYKVIAGLDESGLVVNAYAGFLERRGRWADAIALYRARIDHAPSDAGAAAGLALALRHAKPPPLGDLRQGAAGALTISAAALSSQKQELAALDDLRLALRLDPAQDDAWLLLGELLAPADLDGARAAYASVSAGSDNYVAARDKLAWTYQSAGDHDTALKVARETLAAAPASRDAAANLADLLRGDDQYTESAVVLTRLIDAPGGQGDWRLYYARASSYEEIGDAARTEADLQAALKLNPDQPELLNFQGYFWIDRGEHLKEGLAMIHRAVDADPQSGEIVDSLGWAYYRLGDYASAVAKLEQAITLDPGIPEVNDHLGDAYWRVGRKTEAQFQWRRVLSLAPDAKLKARVEAKLASPLGPDASQAPPPPPQSCTP